LKPLSGKIKKVKDIMEKNKENKLNDWLKKTPAISRLLSIVISIGYVVFSGIALGGKSALQVTAFLILPLLCIWFSEEMGAFTGFMHGHQITATTPGFIVAIGGWLLLLLPVIISAIVFIIGE
jgi:uncharacterized membrane protein YoaT (DUF817 family)